MRTGTAVVLLALLFSLGTSVRADFSGPYALTPPDPGSYFFQTPVIGPFHPNIGAWTCVPGIRGERIDSSLAPVAVTLDTESVGRTVNGYFFTRAVADGIVSFDYTIAGQGGGSFGWFNDGSNFALVPPDVLVSNLQSAPISGSLSVHAGDIFGFYISAEGALFDNAQRTVTLQNFVAPVPEPSTGVLLIVTAAAITGWGICRRK